MSEPNSIPYPEGRRGYEMRSRTAQNDGVASDLEGGSTDQSVENRDDFQLRRLGKNPSLSRNFDVISLVGLNCIVLVTWESVLYNFDNIIGNGGPATFLSAFFFSWIGTLCNIVIIGELASMAPISAGQFHWCAMLSPSKCMKLLSYITACTTALSWQMFVCQASSILGGFIQDLIAFAQGSNYKPAKWKEYLFGLAVQAFAYVPNVIGGRLLPRLEVFAFLVHAIGFFGILIPLAFMPEHKKADEVLTPFLSLGHYSTPSFTWFASAMYYSGIFTGGDCAVHLAEEAEQATKILPSTMIISMVMDGLSGLAMAFALLFSKQTVQDIADGVPYAAMNIFYQTTRSRSAAMIMSCLLIVTFVGRALACIAPASRQIWSTARDRGIPGWQIWKKVSSSNLPTNATTLVVVVALLVNLIPIASSKVYIGIVEAVTPLWCISYTIIGTLLLYRRCKGNILPHGSTNDLRINVPGAKLVWGPFTVPGICGILINCGAILYSVTIFFCGGWPWSVYKNSTWARLNTPTISSLAMMILILVYYFVQARHYYTGPIVETGIYG